jgi:hypothetical protein
MVFAPFVRHQQGHEKRATCRHLNYVLRQLLVALTWIPLLARELDFPPTYQKGVVVEVSEIQHEQVFPQTWMEAESA